MPDDEVYSTIRAIIGDAIGQTIVDITQHDREEWEADRRSYVALHLSGGGTLRFFIGDDGFDYEGV